jgi:hypothetical protein
VGEQLIVHLPKLSLRTRSLCGFRSSHSVRMSFHVWKVTKHEPQVVTQNRAHLLDDGKDLLTMNTLKVSVFDQSNGRVFRTQRVIAFSWRVLKSVIFGTIHHVLPFGVGPVSDESVSTT